MTTKQQRPLVLPPVGRTILRIRGVQAVTGMAASSIYAAIKRGEFPKPVPLWGRTVGWDAAAIDEWVQARLTAKSSA